MWDKPRDTGHAADLGAIAMKAVGTIQPGRSDNGVYPVTPEPLRKLDIVMLGPISVPRKAYSGRLRDGRISAPGAEMTSIDMAGRAL